MNKAKVRVMRFFGNTVEVTVQMGKSKTEYVKTGTPKPTGKYLRKTHWMVSIIRGPQSPAGNPLPESVSADWFRSGRMTLPRLKSLRDWLVKYELGTIYGQVEMAMMDMI